MSVLFGGSHGIAYLGVYWFQICDKYDYFVLIYLVVFAFFDSGIYSL